MCAFACNQQGRGRLFVYGAVSADGQKSRIPLTRQRSDSLKCAPGILANQGGSSGFPKFLRQQGYSLPTPNPHDFKLTHAHPFWCECACMYLSYKMTKRIKFARGINVWRPIVLQSQQSCKTYLAGALLLYLAKCVFVNFNQIQESQF